MKITDILSSERIQQLKNQYQQSGYCCSDPIIKQYLHKTFINNDAIGEEEIKNILSLIPDETTRAETLIKLAGFNIACKHFIRETFENLIKYNSVL